MVSFQGKTLLCNGAVESAAFTRLQNRFIFHANSVDGEPQDVTIFHQFSNVLIIMAGKEFQHAPLILVA
jgi:hypothetical protein